MTRRHSTLWLVKLYPRRWRVRYADEFEMLLHAHPKGARVVFDVIACALYERLSGFGELDMTKLQRSLGLMVYA
jgi:hypothetical protein